MSLEERAQYLLKDVFSSLIAIVNQKEQNL